jgi:hypothetical protein
MERFKPRRESTDHFIKVAEIITPYISEYSEEFIAHRAEIEEMRINLWQDPLPIGEDGFAPIDPHIYISGMERVAIGWLEEATGNVDAVAEGASPEDIYGKDTRPIGFLATSFLADLNLKKSKKLLWAPNMYAGTDGEPYPPYIVVPVGKYGDELAQKIHLVTARLLGGTKFVEESGRKLFANDRSDALRNTVRGQDYNSGFAPVAMLQEGIVTLANCIALLSAEKIEGYEDPDRLIESILTSGLPNEMAKRMPPAVINPVSLSGRYIPDLIGRGQDGKLELNQAIVSTAAAVKAKMRNARGSDISVNPSLGYGCPIAVRSSGSRRTGIEVLQTLFLEEYKKLP